MGGTSEPQGEVFCEVGAPVVCKVSAPSEDGILGSHLCRWFGGKGFMDTLTVCLGLSVTGSPSSE